MEVATKNSEDLWQVMACELLQDAIAQRELSIRQFAQLLAERGVEIETKTLRRRINRGSFDTGFFLMCLTALGAERIEFEGERIADVKLQSNKRWREQRPVA